MRIDLIVVSVIGVGKNESVVIARIADEIVYAIGSIEEIAVLACKLAFAVVDFKSIAGNVSVIVGSLDDFKRGSVDDLNETVAIVERHGIDARHCASDRNAPQVFATIERHAADARYTVRDYDARQAVAIVESGASYACDSFGDIDVCKTRATVERVAVDDGQAIRELYAGEAYTIGERGANACNAVRNDDLRHQNSVQIERGAIVPTVIAERNIQPLLQGSFVIY